MRVSDFRFRSGDIAQLVEQMTFNHWVQGSSPCVPTRKIGRHLVVLFLSGIFFSKNVPALGRFHIHIKDNVY